MNECIYIPAQDDFLNSIIRIFFKNLDCKDTTNIKIFLPTTRSCRKLRKKFFDCGITTIIPEIICPLSKSKFTNDDQIDQFTQIIPILDIYKIIRFNSSFYSRLSLAKDILKFIEQLFFEKLSLEDVSAYCSQSMHTINDKLSECIANSMQLDSVQNYINDKAFYIISLEKEKLSKKQITIIAGFNFAHRYIMDLIKYYCNNAHCIFIQQENLFGSEKCAHYLGLKSTINKPNTITKTIYLLEQKNIYEEAENIAILANKYLLENRDITIVSNNKHFNCILEKALLNFQIYPDNSSGQKFVDTDIGKFFINLLNCFSDNFSIQSVLQLFSSIEKITNQLDIKYRRSIQEFYESLGYLYTKHKTIFGNFIDNYSIIVANNKDTFILSILDIILKHYQIFHKDKDNIKIFLDTFKTLFHEILHTLLEDKNTIKIVAQIFNLLSTLNITNLDTENVIFLIRDIVKDITERTPIGFTERIRILAPIEAQLIKPDVCIVCNFNDSSWQKDNENFFVTNEIREKLSLDWANRRNLNLIDLFFTLASSAEAMIFSNATTGPISGTNMSSYLECFNANIEKIQLDCFNKFKEECTNEKKKNISVLNRNIQTSIGINDLNSTCIELSVTDICDLANNPYEFYAKKILKLPVINLEINHDNFRAIRGSIIHKSIEYIEKNIEKFFSQDREQLIKNRIIDLANSSKIKDIYKKDLLICIDKILFYYTKNIQNNDETFIEHSGELIIELANKTNVKIKCIADRIDRYNDSIIITDFKTGKLPTIAEIINFQKPQIGIESLIFSQNENINDFLLLQLGKSRNNQKKITLNDIIKHRDVKNIDEFLEKYRQELTNLLNKFFVEKSNFEQNLDAHYNEYSHLGRIKEYC